MFQHIVIRHAKCCPLGDRLVLTEFLTGDLRKFSRAFKSLKAMEIFYAQPIFEISRDFKFRLCVKDFEIGTAIRNSKISVSWVYPLREIGRMERRYARYSMLAQGGFSNTGKPRKKNPPLLFPWVFFSGLPCICFSDNFAPFILSKSFLPLPKALSS